MRWSTGISTAIAVLCIHTSTRPLASQEPSPQASNAAELLKQFPVQKQDGHVAPEVVTVKPLLGASRDVVLLGVADYKQPGTIYTHQITGRSIDGSSEVRFWFDTIAIIDEISSEDYTVHLRNGASRRVGWTGADCHGEPNSSWKCAFAAVANPDGTREVIDLTRIRSLDFAASHDAGGQSHVPSMVEFVKQFPITRNAGHIAPVPVTVSPLVGEPRDGMLLGIADTQSAGSLYTHQVRMLSDDASSEVVFWFDTIAALRQITSDDCLVTLKSGATRKARWSGAGCQGAPNPYYRCATAVLANPDGTREVVDLTRVRELTFR